MPEFSKIHCAYIDQETGKQCPNDASVGVTWGIDYLRATEENPKPPTAQLEACGEDHAKALVPEGSDNVEIFELKERK